MSNIKLDGTNPTMCEIRPKPGSQKTIAFSMYNTYCFSNNQH